MTAPVGAFVRIFYDPDPGVEIGTGCVLRTRTGRQYVIVEAHRQERGAHVGRLRLRCVVLDDRNGAEPDAKIRVFPLVWYPRGRVSSWREIRERAGRERRP